MKIYMSAPRDKISLISILIHVCVLALIEGRKKKGKLEFKAIPTSNFVSQKRNSYA